MPIQGADPKLDPNSPEYDPRLDYGSDQFDQQARDDYDAQKASSENQSQTTEPEPGASEQPNVSAPLGGTPPEGTAEPLTKETLWYAYAQQAINGLYPHLRNGVDYVWSRPPDDPTAPPRILSTGENIKPLDEAKIQEAAQKLADADPYSFYEAQQPLHQGSVKEPKTQADLDQQQLDQAKQQSDLPNPELGTPQ
jgi:hypothetical protein